MHRVSWNSLPTSPSPPLGRGCHYPELILVVFSMSHCPALGTGSRFLSPWQQGDPEQSILSSTKAIFLPLTQDTPSSFPNIVPMFYNLTSGIFCRVLLSRRPEDVKCCIRYLRYLHAQWHEVFMKFPLPVTTDLVRALMVQVGLELGDANQDIEEMADLCDELLNSDISTQSLTRPFTDFARAIKFHFNEPSEVEIPSEKVIDCLRMAIVRLPGLHQVSVELARSLFFRFVVAPSDDDYEEGMTIFDRILTSCGSGDGPSLIRTEALHLAAVFAVARFDAYGKPEHLEHAIYRFRTWLDGTSIEDPNRAKIIKDLADVERSRLDGTGNTRDARPIPPKSAKIPSFRDLVASLPDPMAIKPKSMKTSREHLDALRAPYIYQLTDVGNIEDGIKYCRHLLVSYPRGELTSTAQESLGNLLHRAFQCTHKIKYLDEAILATRDGINSTIPLSSGSRFVLLVGLTFMLSTRLELLCHEEDLHELMRLFPAAADYTLGNSRDRRPMSIHWASIARRFGHPSASTAYDHAMSSIQSSLTFSPTLDIQHSRLAAMRDGLQTIPLDYASYHIDTGHLEHAIETLERGRGLLWSEMRGLRPSIDQIRLADSNLADKFSAVNRELETLTLTFSLNNGVDRNNNLEGMDPYGHSVMRKQKLLDDREKLITQIQALSGFHTFLKPPSFDTLRSATSRGPIIIINHCKWRSDIIVLLYNFPPSIISTSDDFYGRAHNLQKQLLGERRKGLESGKYEEALRAVLKELYELVGRPVIKRLNELNIPEQSRVWWCPTSVFCSLPLHAMGPILSDVGPPRYFLDLYIPSYIPSLSALIDSRKSSLQTLNKPSILLVAQPDEKMPQALKEMKEVQAVDTQVTTLFSAKATPTAVLKRLRDHPFAHIVCHGILEPGKPFEASFKLHRGKRLQLLDVVRSQLPDAEFAFLSACHTAELTDESIADEVLHLAAAMQFCGFRSVVGTMWAMADVDGRDLARSFYESVFSDETHVVRYYERTAEALRDAVVKLRRKRGMTLERWVNYVHHGA